MGVVCDVSGFFCFAVVLWCVPAEDECIGVDVDDEFVIVSEFEHTIVGDFANLDAWDGSTFADVMCLFFVSFFNYGEHSFLSFGEE